MALRAGAGSLGAGASRGEEVPLLGERTWTQVGDNAQVTSGTGLATSGLRASLTGGGLQHETEHAARGGNLRTAYLAGEIPDRGQGCSGPARYSRDRDGRLGATAGLGGWDMHPMWGMWGLWGIGMMLGMLVFWGLVITGVVLGIRWLVRQGSAESKGDRALDILRERYARGEINREEFLARKRDL
jgi:putative membrane protein